MERFGRILRRALFPGPAVVIISVPLAAALLTYTFACEQEDSPVAYLAYVLSAYSLTIVCAWTAKYARGARRTVETAIHRNRLAHRYLTDVSFKTHVSLYVSLGLNLLYAALKLFYGVYYRSVWFGTLAVYYILLAVMRFSLLRHVSRNALGKNLASELRQYRLCGVILMLMNIALTGVVILVVQKNEGFAYAGYLIYVMAMYAFYNIITAVRDVVRFRKYKSPVMSAAKAVRLAAALVSMLSLETAMLTQFDERNGPAFRQLMTGLTGGGVCLLVLAMAVFMIARASGQLRALREQGAGETEEWQ
ncbi:MAG: hypothetical protein ACI3W8_02335 [Oscillospiraceae bacterium]